MARLSLRRRRRTKLDTVKDLAQIYTTLKLSQAGGRAAKTAAKGYAGVKAAKGSRKLGPSPARGGGDRRARRLPQAAQPPADGL
jgi:hypothetical protein